MAYRPPVGNATTTSRGIVQLAGDLGGTATSVSVQKVNGVSLSGTPLNGQVITATSGTTANWATPASTPTATGSTTGTVTLAGDLSGSAATPTVARVNGVSVSGTPTTGQVITATSGSAASWQTPSTGFADPLTTKGDIIVRGVATTRQSVGLNNQVLIADSAQTTGLRWGTVDDTSAVKLAGSTMTGQLIVPTFRVTGGSPATGRILVSDGTGNATWQVALGTTPNISTRSGAYSAVVGDYILANASAGTGFTVTLPTAASAGNGAKVCVKKIDSSANAVDIVVSGGGIIDSSVSDSISTRWESHDFISDGTQWYLV